MQKAQSQDTIVSPFHPGEQQVQSRVGVRKMMEQFGQRVIRPYMPDEHRAFFEQLPFLVVGGVDDQGWPWASLLCGTPGFIQSPDAKTLTIGVAPAASSPLAGAIEPGAQLGLLGIEINTRRRNRMNGHVGALCDGGFTVSVDQSFGNCPQYIQRRSVDFIRDPEQVNHQADASHFVDLDGDTQAMIRAADTFFVASFTDGDEGRRTNGVDVSHRGGKPGFVKVEGNTLTVPDYAGNQFFNTLGNFQTTPKAGLAFADFDTGNLLMLTGTVELLWENNAQVQAFRGAERAWRFTLDHGVMLNDALPFRARLEDYSPMTMITGDWNEAEAVLSAQAKHQSWRPFRLMRTEDESSVIRSFYLEPADGGAVVPFEAGQFLTLRLTLPGSKKPVIRTYTVSSSPDLPFYRISVKREDNGVVSRFLHDSLKVDDLIDVRAPRGDFFIDAAQKRPAVLIAGGVGITPMIAMASHVMKEGMRTRHTRALTVFHSAQTTKQRAFAQHFKALEQQTDNRIRYISLVDQPMNGEEAGTDFHHTGYINADILRQALPLDDYDFYLCGPPPFMQSLYDTLRRLGVRDQRIYAEAFGPASLQRSTDNESTAPPQAEEVEEADQALIKFSKSQFEQRWSAGDATFLEVAETHGLEPNYGCRNGVCGSCSVKLKAGAVTYRTRPTAKIAQGEVLICCSVPAKGSDTVEIEL